MFSTLRGQQIAGIIMMMVAPTVAFLLAMNAAGVPLGVATSLGGFAWMMFVLIIGIMLYWSITAGEWPKRTISIAIGTIIASIVISLLIAGGFAIHQAGNSITDPELLEIKKEMGIVGVAKDAMVGVTPTELAMKELERKVQEDEAAKIDAAAQNPNSDLYQQVQKEVQSSWSVAQIVEEATKTPRERVYRLSERLQWAPSYWTFMFMALLYASGAIALWAVLSSTLGVGVKPLKDDCTWFQYSDYWFRRLIVVGLGKFALAWILYTVMGLMENEILPDEPPPGWHQEAPAPPPPPAPKQNRPVANQAAPRHVQPGVRPPICDTNPRAAAHLDVCKR